MIVPRHFSRGQQIDRAVMLKNLDVSAGFEGFDQRPLYFSPSDVGEVQYSPVAVSTFSGQIIG